ncbi:f32e9f32-1f26-470b-9d15-45451122ce46 [Sclerotinia trifoliorum]|uniref:F32e9f32-1f26-470b-9d15-45451122ce46 n=1 Tax=Sclerotinia trifoliorum TaxID=28548 RepID=A0A8H2VM23_9HELO|nr:f32e9f32-1f26-470b-9d15-45451122ce46 [Sclerotinia trifoliorum]
MSSFIDIKRVREQAELLTLPRCSFILGTDTAPFRGGECLIYVLQDQSQTKIGIRIPHAEWLTPDKVREEFYFRKSLEERNVRGLQKMIAFNDEYENHLGHPWIASLWVDGETLKWSISQPKQQLRRMALMEGIARISVDFLQVQKLGITIAINRVESGALQDANMLKECGDQERLIDRYLPLQGEEVPHVLVHNDLCGNNIIVNENAELQCVIDLGQAEMLPIALAAVYPPFLTHDPALKGQDINWAARDTETMQRDRAFYLGCIRELALAKRGLAEEYYANLARKDEIDKYWWFVAATCKTMYNAMAACNWKPPVRIARRVILGIIDTILWPLQQPDPSRQKDMTMMIFIYSLLLIIEMAAWNHLSLHF